MIGSVNQTAITFSSLNTFRYASSTPSIKAIKSLNGMRLAGENRKHDKNFKFSLLRSSKSICILASQRYTGLITTIVIEATDI